MGLKVSFFSLHVFVGQWVNPWKTFFLSSLGPVLILNF
jgi:hypothetical protein